jgi:imidazoleglycerol-phosphate dehydratase
MRISEIKRKTSETDITLTLNLDGTGNSDIVTDCGFLNHMLELFARHGRFDLKLRCIGDSQVDFHHTVEDVGIVLGMAFKEALGDKRGIVRYGYMVLPMDETLILCAIDLSGRAYLNDDLRFRAKRIGDFDTELVEEFLLAFTRELGFTLHLIQLEGKNTHHIIEGGFKCMARALSKAVAIDEKHPDEIPSTKGML